MPVGHGVIRRSRFLCLYKKETMNLLLPILCTRGGRSLRSKLFIRLAALIADIFCWENSIFSLFNYTRMSPSLFGGASSLTIGSCLSIPVDGRPVIRTNKDYEAYLCKFTSYEGIILNGYVLQTWLSLNKNNVKTSQMLHQILTAQGHECTFIGINSALARLTREVQVFKKSINKNWNRITEILNLPFRIPVVKSVKKIEPIYEAVTVISQENKESAEEKTEMKLKRDCKKCPVIRKSFMTTISDLKSKLRASKNLARDISKRFDVKRVNYNFKRNAATRDKLRQEKFLLRKENLKLQKKLNYLKSKSDVPPPRKTEKRIQSKKECNFVKEKIIGLKNIIKDKEERIKELDFEVCYLRNRVKELEKQFNTATIVTTLGDSEMEHKRKQYSVPIRKCIYMCILNQVAIEKAGPIIEFVIKELCHRRVSSIPGPSTASLMAYEMGVISDLQLGEHLFNAQDGTATISWDATTKESCHVNECHIAVDGQQLTMKLSSLSSGKTESYVGQITTSIQNLATTFALYKNIQQQIVLHKFRNCFASTLTDRAAVNHCVNQELSAFLSTELVELNCNVHPIEGIASQARRILKKLDKEFNVNSGLFGSEGRAANLLYSISKLRYKMKSGDPGGFRAFLNLKNLACGVITRYVGNRMHVLFHLAGTVYHLRDILKEFLSKYKGDAKMSVAILKDLENPHIIIQLRILGLFGKVLSGPWMTLFYQNKAGRAHLEMGPFMKVCLEQLLKLKLQPDLLISMGEDCFNNCLATDDPVLASLKNGGTDELFNKITRALAEGFVIVLERQLKSYLTGALSSVTPELLAKTSSAPLHNMHSERVLGMLDHQLRRSPNATMGFIDGKIKFSVNKTMAWLLDKSPTEQKALIKFAISHSRSIKDHCETWEKSVKESVLTKLIEAGQRKDRSNRKKVEKDVKQFLHNPDLGTAVMGILEEDHQHIFEALSRGDHNLVGCRFEHVWDVGGVDEVFIGVIRGFSKGSKPSISIQYEDEDKDEDVTLVYITELLTDMLLGDVRFL